MLAWDLGALTHRCVVQTLRKRVFEVVDVMSAVKKLQQCRGDPKVTKEEQYALWEQVKVSGKRLLGGQSR
jgi:hypothetical protein